MKDILIELNETVREIQSGVRNIMCGDELLMMLFRSAEEIKRLRDSNSDMGWRLNPDRMGGSFSEWETNRRGDEWS
jgi:hypothetical protein